MSIAYTGLEAMMDTMLMDTAMMMLWMIAASTVLLGSTYILAHGRVLHGRINAAFKALEEAFELDEIHVPAGGAVVVGVREGVGVMEGVAMGVRLEGKTCRVRWELGLGVKGAMLRTVSTRQRVEDTLGLQGRLASGDSSFDARFEVRGDDEVALAHVLGADARAALMEERVGRVEIDEDTLSVSWATDVFLRDPEGCVEASCALMLALRRARSDARADGAEARLGAQVQAPVAVARDV